MSDPRAALRRFVRWVMRDTRYQRVYSATVEIDHGDGTVDVLPDDESIRGNGMQRIPVAAGIAGCGSRVVRGTRCLVGFSNGDPRRPRVMAWEFAKDSAVVTIAGGQSGVARVGDLVKGATSPSPEPVQGIAAGILTTPGGPVPIPAPPTPGVPAPAGVPFSGTITVTGSIIGIINDGAARVKA